jgi:ribosomal-protein-alanine N-acetyltransferase
MELSESGLEDMYEYSKNPQLYKYFEFEPQKTIDETREYLQKLIDRSNADNAHYWFISLAATNKIIGSFGVHDIDWRKGKAEISYGLSPHYWGKGHFHEVLKMVMKYLFDDRNFFRIHATTRHDNLPSIKALEKAGFQKEGVLRSFYLSYDGKRHDAVILSILKPEYYSQPHEE